MNGLIERTINDYNILIDIHKANEVFFEENAIQSNKDLSNITPIELCNIISPNKFTPLLLTWELLDKCSFACPFCYIVGHSKNKIVRFSEMENHINELIQMGLLYCSLTGGEATLHPDFIEIYTYLKKRGVLIELYTNGSLLEEKHFELFSDLPPFKIEITIYGLTENSFKNATGTNKFDYKKILENILLLKRKGINIVCKTPINTCTIQEFDEIQKWCNENQIKFYYSTNITDGYDGDSLGNFSVDFAQKIKYEAQKIEEIYKEHPTQFENNKRSIKSCYTCSIRNYGFHINSGFEIMPCSETHLFETKTSILENNIHSGIKKYRDFINQFLDKNIVGCSGCEASSICKMCTAKAEPVRNSNNKITDFKVPSGHCENERKKVANIYDHIITNSSFS
jgi:MoaA/NifB/PqqE/SkfB family radical SAM enzyme